VCGGLRGSSGSELVGWQGEGEAEGGVEEGVGGGWGKWWKEWQKEGQKEWQKEGQGPMVEQWQPESDRAEAHQQD
jgi:hypothetical protein